ncbi:hypothetical protein HMPREF3190_01426 [Umbribacter vaginalis]|nr:hypothetical protein HMPREF3190_01426 [Coriobacteriales bacterium DNF00809]
MFPLVHEWYACCDYRALAFAAARCRLILRNVFVLQRHCISASNALISAVRE